MFGEVKQMKKGIQIKEDIYWVGVRDFNNRHFHGSLYPIQEGATYNAYLVVDDEVTLFDTVEEEFAEEMLERIRSVIGDRPVDNIIVQHAEPDHSGGFLHVMRAYPQAKVYASNAGANNMMKQYFKEVEYNRVKTKDTLSTGKHQFTFVEMPLIHWPDNMLTYDAEAKIVFSNDAFGQHIVSFKLFDEAHDLSFCLDKAKEYYANIVMPYGAQVSAKLRQIQEMNLEIEMIAPAHGIIWKSYIPQLLEAYEGFASFRSTDKAVIVYESVWSHTRQMAEALAEGMGEAGMEVKVYQHSVTDSSIIMKEILDASVVLVGSGCYNNAMSPEIAGFIDKLASCKIKGKKALGFGAYGWFGNTVKTINERLQDAGFALASDAVLSQCYTPSEDDLDRYTEIDHAIAQEAMR